MKMPADLCGPAHDFDQFIGKIFGMGSHKADPFDLVNFFDLRKKFGKGNRMVQCLAVRIYILSKQHDLYNTIVGKPPDLS